MFKNQGCDDSLNKYPASSSTDPGNEDGDVSRYVHLKIDNIKKISFGMA